MQEQLPDERDLGILWAPTRNKDGHRKSHWSSMTRVEEGDVIIHYAGLHVRAVSRVSPPPRRLHRARSTQWNPAAVDSFVGDIDELPVPLHRDEIPLDLRRSQTQPNAPYFLHGGRVAMSIWSTSSISLQMPGRRSLT